MIVTTLNEFVSVVFWPSAIRVSPSAWLMPPPATKIFADTTVRATDNTCILVVPEDKAGGTSGLGESCLGGEITRTTVDERDAARQVGGIVGLLR